MSNVKIRKNDEISNVHSMTDSLFLIDDPSDVLFWGPDAEPSSMVLHNGAAQSLVFDLEERTAVFGEAIIQFAKTIPLNPVNNRLIDQLVGCGIAVGANYCEADDASFEEGFQKQDRHLPKRSQRNEILPAHDRQL